jgi:predicted dehydrogenase
MLDGEQWMDTLRGAVIGTGYFSQFHFDAWQRIDGIEIVACCDRDRDTADEVSQRFSIPSVFTEFREMLDAVDVDFVDVITRPETHFEICQELARRGIATICQKPLAPSFRESAELVDAVEAAGVRMMVHENFRFQPWYREIKQLITSGAIGDRLHTITFRNRAGDGWGDDAYLARQPYFQEMERFLLYEAGIHTIDTFRYLAGEISRVWCFLRRLNPVIAGEDTAISVMEFRDGGVGLYDANRYNESTAADPRYTFGRLIVEGNGGTIRLDDEGRLTTQPLGQSERKHPYTPSKQGFAGDCVRATQQHFVDCLRAGTEFETSGREYLKSIAVQEAMYRSAQTGCWQKASEV